MSTTYNLVCDDCKVQYWAGQHDRIYYQKDLDEFLFFHIGCRLRFLSDLSEDKMSQNYKYVGENND